MLSFPSRIDAVESHGYDSLLSGASNQNFITLRWRFTSILFLLEFFAQEEEVRKTGPSRWVVGKVSPQDPFPVLSKSIQYIEGIPFHCFHD
jgi:hypothetical protein